MIENLREAASLATLIQKNLPTGLPQIPTTSTVAAIEALESVGSTSAKDLSEKELLSAINDFVSDYGLESDAMDAKASAGDEVASFTLGLGATMIVWLILQAEIKFERDKEGKWMVSFKKKPTASPAIMNLLAFVKKHLG